MAVGSLLVSWFETATERGKPALGDPEVLSWENFTSIFIWRREGVKDGCCFVPARFQLEPDGRQVRRLKKNVLARTGIALDVEANKDTGEVPPTLDDAVNRASVMGWACLAYTSHNHRPDNIRYRMVFPLSVEIDPELPAPEIVAEQLGMEGVLDRSKLGPASVFYLASCPYDALDMHQTVVTPGGPIDAAWMVERAGALLALRQAEADRIAEEQHAEAAERREAKIAAGFDPDDSLIEKLRSRFDMASVLVAHGYDRAGGKFRHPNSESGSFGADIKVFAGIERVFSHNGSDPLHGSNLPAWCGGVTALDAFDVVVILDFAGDRNRAMRDLAQRFGLTKKAELTAIARLLHNLIRRNATQQEIERSAFAEGESRGLTRDDVIRVARWVANQPNAGKAA